MIKKYSHYITPLLYLFGIFGTFILYLATKPYIPYSLDSINYIKLAEAIQQGRWYIHIREDYMTTFPPFYSMLISLFEKRTASLLFVRTVPVLNLSKLPISASLQLDKSAIPG